MKQVERTRYSSIYLKPDRVARIRHCLRRCGLVFFFQAEDGIRDYKVTGVQTCALPISPPIWNTDFGRMAPGPTAATSDSVRRKCSSMTGLQVPFRPQNGGRQLLSQDSPDRKSVV